MRTILKECIKAILDKNSKKKALSEKLERKELLRGPGLLAPCLCFS
jgi:hypothetical protein